MNDKQLIKRIIALALKIKETESLSEAAEELRTMEIEKMFTTKEGKYYTLKTWQINIINVIKSHNKRSENENKL